MENSKSIDDRLSNIEALLSSQKTVLNLKELAAYTGLSKSYIYKLTHLGLIKFSKPNGKNIYFEKKEVDEFLLQNRSKSHEEQVTEANTYVTLNKKGGAK